MKACAAAALFLCLAATPASAQARGRSWEVAPGAVWFSGVDLGKSTATLERPGGGSFDLFETETRLDGGIGGGASVSLYVSPRVAIDATFSYARSSMSTRVTADAEDAGPITAEIGLQQYLIEGGLRWYLDRSRGSWRPYLRAGGGYLRQLDDANAHVETGKTLHAGLGVDRPFRERAHGRLRRAGLRLDARLLARQGGFDVDDSLRLGVSAGAALFLGF